MLMSVEMDLNSFEEVDNEIHKNCEASEQEVWTKPPNLKGMKLKNTALIYDRIGISDKAAAVVVSSVLKDVGILTNDGHSHVVDKCEMRREKS